MARSAVDPDAWKRIVLQSMKPPAWLQSDGDVREIVLSTRVRHMRNFRGHRFTHAAGPEELREIGVRAKNAVLSIGGYEIQQRVSPAERDYLIACRLASPDFDWGAPGRFLALDADRSSSIMIGEEDHLRIQALTPGWSLGWAIDLAETALRQLSDRLDFAQSPVYGFLAASPSNCGDGIRHSAMFHLIGLAHVKRLGVVIRALTSQGLVVRGLFGERSRAIGAFVQVSTTRRSLPHFVGACDYLLREEKLARAGVPKPAPHERVRETKELLLGARGASLADAMRILAWVRWQRAEAASADGLREIDSLIPELALLESLGEPRAGRARLDLLQRVLGV